jgi:hypothetical protein
MEAIASSNYNDTTIVGNVTRQMFSWYLNDNLRHPLDYWTSLCDNYWQSIRQCMVRKPFQYYWWRTSVSFIYNACMNGLTALGGWRMEACVLATLSNNSDIRSIDCGRAMQCFRPKNTAAGANNDSTAITESENNSLFVPSFPGRQYQLYAERWVANLNQKQQALVMGQRAIFGTYIELFFGRLSKRNYWIYYASYTAIGVGIFVVFALIFPVYSLMLGVGGIVANVILLAGNHVFANLLLGYHEIKEQDAGYTLSPVVFEAS